MDGSAEAEAEAAELAVRTDSIASEEALASATTGACNGAGLDSVTAAGPRFRLGATAAKLAGARVADVCAVARAVAVGAVCPTEVPLLVSISKGAVLMVAPSAADNTADPHLVEAEAKSTFKIGILIVSAQRIGFDGMLEIAAIVAAV
jgi:hypothetical protein